MNSPNYNSNSSIEHLDALFQEMDGCAIYLASVYTGKYLYLSKAIEKIYGHDLEEYLTGGLNFLFSIMHPDDYRHSVDHFMSQMNKTMALEDKEHSITTGTNTVRIKHADGCYIWTTMSYVLLDYSGGKPNRLVGFFKSIDKETQREIFLLEQLRNELPVERYSKIKEQFKTLSNHFNPKTLETPELHELLDVPFSNSQTVKLTSREKGVLKLISDGLSDKIIADQLNISNFTARTHRKNILKKYGAKNTAELIKDASKSYWL